MSEFELVETTRSAPYLCSIRLPGVGLLFPVKK